MLLLLRPWSAGKDAGKKREGKFPDRLLRLMREMFGSQNAKWCHEEPSRIEICVDSGRAVVDPHSLVVETKDEGLHHLVSAAAKRLHTTLNSS